MGVEGRGEECPDMAAHNQMRERLEFYHQNPPRRLPPCCPGRGGQSIPAALLSPPLLCPSDKVIWRSALLAAVRGVTLTQARRVPATRGPQVLGQGEPDQELDLELDPELDPVSRDVEPLSLHL